MFAARFQRPALLSLASFLLLAGALHTNNALAWSFNWGSGTAVTGSGNVVSSTRVVNGFNGLEVGVPANVKIVQGEAEGLVIKTDENITALIETVVERGTLRIRFADKVKSVRAKQMDITVFVKSIDVLTIQGSGTIQTDKLKADKLKANIEGSGDIALAGLEVGHLDVSIAGSGDVRGDGKADSLATNIAGSGGVQLGQLLAKNVKVSIAGSGNTLVWATEKLRISIAGSGDVRYYGDASVTSSVAGSGNVQRLGAAPPATKPQ